MHRLCHKCMDVWGPLVVCTRAYSTAWHPLTYQLLSCVLPGYRLCSSAAVAWVSVFLSQGVHGYPMPLPLVFWHSLPLQCSVVIPPLLPWAAPTTSSTRTTSTRTISRNSIVCFWARQARPTRPPFSACGLPPGVLADLLRHSFWNYYLCTRTMVCECQHTRAGQKESYLLYSNFLCFGHTFSILCIPGDREGQATIRRS